ncbi:MAG TPA: type II secretion system protein [Candidatus Babeliales bacterium]|jgi:prepilin-type N-terminal cleavage/methylation domain-containing protein|nr:type II secretion system protein [Candidatus Babeliales bacterium]
MIHSKNRKHGFTLIETVLAMVIASLVFTPMFIILATVMQRVNRRATEFTYLLLGKNLLYEARQKQEPQAETFSLNTTDIASGATVSYVLEKGVDQKSPLASLQGLHKESVKISWVEQERKKHEQLITFVYKQPEQKKS